MILKHLCKAGNGSIPTSHYSWDDPPETSTFGLIPKCFGRCRDSSSQGSSSDSDGEEEKIARYFSVIDCQSFIFAYLNIERINLGIHNN